MLYSELIHIISVPFHEIAYHSADKAHAQIAYNMRETIPYDCPGNNFSADMALLCTSWLAMHIILAASDLHVGRDRSQPTGQGASVRYMKLL